jgi:glycosyltransferase involved in cell wall biosynthesis
MASPNLRSKVRLAIVGYETSGSRDYVATLRARAKQLGIEDAIQYFGAVPDRQEMLKIAREADLGIALLPMRDGDANHATMVGASNKPFDYLSQGVPVLVNCEQPWIECFVTSGYGRCCDPANSASIASQLRWFLENPDERTSMGAGGQSRIRSDWNYESQFAPVLSLLESITSLSHNSASQEPGRRDHRSFTAA